MFDPIYKRGCRKVQGVRVFGYSLKIPDLQDYPRIFKFYEDISDTVIKHCEGELGERAEREFLSLTEKDRRTVFRPSIYSLDGEVTYFDGELMFIKLIASLRSPKDISPRKAVEAHAWTLDDQMLVPPRSAARRFFPSGRLPITLWDDGFLVENGKYFVCRDGDLFPVVESKKSLKQKGRKKHEKESI